MVMFYTSYFTGRNISLLSPEHFFLDCFIYSLERQLLFDLIEHYVPNFKRFYKKEKLDLILKGVNIDTTLTKVVQHLFFSTKRFHED